MNNCFVIHHKKNQLDLPHLLRQMTNFLKILEMQADVVEMIEMKEDMIAHKVDLENGNMTNIVSKGTVMEEIMGKEGCKRQGQSLIEGKFFIFLITLNFDLN